MEWHKLCSTRHEHEQIYRIDVIKREMVRAIKLLRTRYLMCSVFMNVTFAILCESSAKIEEKPKKECESEENRQREQRQPYVLVYRISAQFDGNANSAQHKNSHEFECY